jgi:hypothetical protein
VALIVGRVVDADGRPVSGAVVHVVSAPRPVPDIAQLADDAGEFTLALGPGAHVIGARSDSAGSGEATFEVSDDPEASTSVVVRVRAHAR